ncbi:hypothetical protein ACIOWI_33030 [Streptomyces sp. NPDC087659]|uniref:hypothetical protein n=1 Tax=Streptomyces sp. NPDC087659 TaxID=3365801 RepID=UPI00382D752A
MIATIDTTPGSADAPVPDDWRVTPEGTVAVVDVARTTGDYPAVNYTVRKCEIPVMERQGRGGGRYIPVSEALLLVVAAALAVAAGVALVQMYRAIKANGATISADALTIPLSLRK